MDFKPSNTRIIFINIQLVEEVKCKKLLSAMNSRGRKLIIHEEIYMWQRQIRKLNFGIKLNRLDKHIGNAPESYWLLYLANYSCPPTIELCCSSLCLLIKTYSLFALFSYSFKWHQLEMTWNSIAIFFTLFLIFHLFIRGGEL